LVLAAKRLGALAIDRQITTNRIGQVSAVGAKKRGQGRLVRESSPQRLHMGLRHGYQVIGLKSQLASDRPRNMSLDVNAQFAGHLHRLGSGPVTGPGRQSGGLHEKSFSGQIIHGALQFFGQHFLAQSLGHRTATSIPRANEQYQARGQGLQIARVKHSFSNDFP